MLQFLRTRGHWDVPYSCAKRRKERDTMEPDGIRIVVINGSVRPRNYTSMASSFVVDELKKRPKVSVQVINPATLHLPFPGLDSNTEDTRLLQQKVAHAAGVVLATPEYHG